MPLGEVEHVDLRRRRRPHDRATSAPTTARPTACARRRSSPASSATATGSALITAGRDARDLHRVGRRSRVPRWMAGSGPRLGHGRVRDAARRRPASASSATSRKGRPDGRTVEIQRLIGRSLRGVVDFEALGERTIYLDCDVLQADGGTRCASITGALRRARRWRAQRSSPTASSTRSPLTGTRRGDLVRDRRRASRCSTSTTPRTRPRRSTRTSS